MADERLIAVFVDYENLAIGVRGMRKGNFKIDLVLRRLLEKGRIVYRRAYCDWNRYRSVVRDFHSHGIEMVDIPLSKASGKNSADIHMVVDALDLCYSKEHINTFALLSGDSDFSPLVSKLKENDKRVIGLGVKKSTSDLLIASCDEFIYYEDLVRERPQKPKVSGLSEKQSEAFDVLVEAIEALQRENWEVLYSSLIKDTIKRKRPSFDEGYHGYSSFSKLLEDASRRGLVQIEKSPKSGTYVVTGLSEKT